MGRKSIGYKIDLIFENNDLFIFAAQKKSMYAYLQGKLTYKSPTEVYLDVNGVGYHLLISLQTYGAIEDKDEIKLYTLLYVREDVMSLFGFSNESEKQMFVHLLSVSGIGPNTARVVLSSMTVPEVSQAILAENVAAFNKVKGIGPKTAKRLILDLKDKMAKMGIEPVNMPAANTQNSNREEVLSALISLGFHRQKITKKIDEIMGSNPNLTQVEEIIKEVLKQIS